MERVFGILNGFSKMSKDEKLEFIGNLFTNKAEVIKQIKSFQHKDDEVQELLEEFSENTISNFHLPYSIAPNFLINNKKTIFRINFFKRCNNCNFVNVESLMYLRKYKIFNCISFF